MPYRFGARHADVLHDLARAEHVRWIAEVQGWADDAGAEGDVESQRRFLGQVEGLWAIPYPWEAAPAAQRCAVTVGTQRNDRVGACGPSDS